MKLFFLMTLTITILSSEVFADTATLANPMCTIESSPSDSCLYGNWTANKESYKKLLEDLGRDLITVESITGNVNLGFDSTGKSEINYDNFEVKTSIGGFAKVRYLYQGGSKIRYTNQNNNTQICSELESSTLVMKAWMTINGNETEIPLTDSPIDTNNLIGYSCKNSKLSLIYTTGTENFEWVFDR